MAHAAIGTTRRNFESADSYLPWDRSRSRTYTIFGERQTLKLIGLDRAGEATPKTTAETRTLDWAR
jgi:hypothetical protein